MNQKSIDEMRTRGTENKEINMKDVIKIYPHFQFRYADIIVKEKFVFKIITVDYKKNPRTVEEMLDENNWERKSEKEFPITDLELELQARA